MQVETSHTWDKLTIRLFDNEAISLIEAIDAIVDPTENPPQPELLEILK